MAADSPTCQLVLFGEKTRLDGWELNPVWLKGSLMEGKGSLLIPKQLHYILRHDRQFMFEIGL